MQLHKKTVIIRCLEGRFTNRQAAAELMLSNRRVQQLKADYIQRGDAVFIHGNTGRRPANTISRSIRDQIIKLKRRYEYQVSNYTHFTELLSEKHGITLHSTTVGTILRQSGIKSPRKHRTKKNGIHYPRLRKEHEGDLLQADASSYDWFGTGRKATLHGFVDDATGIPTGLYFMRHECLMGYLEVTRQTIQNKGIPEALYPDRAGIFFLPKKKSDELTIEEQLNYTQGK